MECRVFSFCLVLFALLSFCSVANGQTQLHDAANPKAKIQPWTWQQNDRIALVGDGLIERAQFHGQFETRLVRRFPKLDLNFRNFGWTGDTARGDGRVLGYEKPAGKARLLQELNSYKPTVILIGYGMTDSLVPQTMPEFAEDLRTLVDELSKITPQIVMLTPIQHESTASPLPSSAKQKHNKVLAKITRTIIDMAGKRRLRVVDLFHGLDDDNNEKDVLTSNGIHLNPLGYWNFGRALEQQLDFLPSSANVHVTASGEVISVQNTTVTGIRRGDGRLEFQMRLEHLPAPTATGEAKRDNQNIELKITGLGNGTYELRHGENVLATAQAEAWSQGVTWSVGPDSRQMDRLRAVIVAKNKLCFRQLRPYNDMHRHWGYIGDEFDDYSPLISDMEKKVAELRHPASHRYVLSRLVD